MDRWKSVVRVPVGNSQYRVAVSCDRLVPTANVIFFHGDRVEAATNPLVARLSDIRSIADLLVCKFGSSVNAWVIEASTFNGPFAIYRDFVPSVNRFGEPKSYKAVGFPASMSLVSLLQNCVRQVGFGELASSTSVRPKTVLVGFSKGGTVINQLVTEVAFLDNVSEGCREGQIMPESREELLDSISEVHYVDVGLNAPNAYITEQKVINGIAKRCVRRKNGMRFVIHGTPRQWRDPRRQLIRREKDELVTLLESASRTCNGYLQVCERFYFADKLPDLQMHFQVLDSMDVTVT